MNYQTIRFDQQEAEKSASSNYIPGNTAQRVKIDRAEFITSPKTGAQGIEFDVHTKDGQKGYFTIWHLKGDGSANEYSWRLLQSLMGVCGVQTLTPTSVAVPKYNAQTKNTEQTACINAPLTPSAAPTSSPSTRRGSLIFHTTDSARLTPSGPAIRIRGTSPTGMWYCPTDTENRTTPTNSTRSMANSTTRRRVRVRNTSLAAGLPAFAVSRLYSGR